MGTISAIIVWIFFGLVAGLLARAIVPGRQAMGWMATILLGIVGSFAGGFITYLIQGGDPMQPTGMIMSILGAVIILVLATSVAPKRI